MFERMLQDHFPEDLRALESRLERNPLTSFHELFGNMAESLFLCMMQSAYNLPERLTAAVPGWPPRELRLRTTSDQSIAETLREASAFWREARTLFEQRSGQLIAKARVADYGAGWGRVARLIAKDVPADQLVAFEPNEELRKWYVSAGVPGTVVATDWDSEISLESFGTFDLVLLFSIFTHTSEDLARRIAKRLVELTKPGSLIVLTVRPRWFLDGGEGDAALLPRDERAGLVTKFDHEDFLFLPYDGSSDWGVTVMGKRFLEKVFDVRCDVKYVAPIFETPNQVMVAVERR